MSETNKGGLASRVVRSKLAFTIWVVAVSLVAIPLLYHAQAQVGPGTFDVRVSPAIDGGTDLAIPPLGTISAQTHQAPVRLAVELREVNVADAIGPTQQRGLGGLERQIRDDIPGAVIHLLVIMVLVSGATGAVAALMFPGNRSWKRLVSGSAIGVVTALALSTPAAIGYDATMFESNPRLSGPIGASQSLVATVGGLDTRFGSVRSRTEVLAERIADLYSAATTRDIARSGGETVILHVSDLHLNSVGMSLAKELAEKFAVDAVIDTGDITSFGFAPEAGFIDQLKGFDTPYYVIGGNHDSLAVREQLKSSPYLTYVDNRTFQVGDVRILGVPDPTVTALRRIPQHEIDETYRAQFKTIERLVDQRDPDLVMVHNPVQLRPILGKVQVASAGHLHETKLEIIKGTVVEIVGSSGATGIGDLLVDQSKPYRFDLLRFRGNTLVAVDQLELEGAGGNFTLTRHLIVPDESDTTENLPEASGQEPSREEIEEEDPEILDEVTSTTTDDTTTTTDAGTGAGDAPEESTSIPSGTDNRPETTTTQP